MARRPCDFTAATRLFLSADPRLVSLAVDEYTDFVLPQTALWEITPAGDIWLSHGDARSSRCANGKSILSLMLLGATPGAVITIEARGEDEAEALNALAELIAARFGEEP